MALLDLGDGSLSGCPGAGHKDGPVTHEGQHLGGDPPKAPPPPVTSTVLMTIAPRWQMRQRRRGSLGRFSSGRRRLR